MFVEQAAWPGQMLDDESLLISGADVIILDGGAGCVDEAMAGAVPNRLPWFEHACCRCRVSLLGRSTISLYWNRITPGGMMVTVAEVCNASDKLRCGLSVSGARGWQLIMCAPVHLRIGGSRG